MTEVLLIGGPSFLDGTRKEVESPWDRRPLQFCDDCDRPFSQMWESGYRKYETNFTVHTYTFHEIRGVSRTWWIGIHHSINSDQALELILGSYP